ncbi:hypothetical protein Val02_04930 [Virgisporangium aliadipatigenens]|uniref:Uncharacterized protein n=1 Tax=Virgisporangium aliadipatigenens TaxID=741659 RepID=A0A8J3YFS8_9ACTN|nr:hypothetical protein [Virgisporangium aliadipatigenens]GIJ43607.1 hypothetical protein Val02_04930 [Virgisporangium aliadipatigenens]
MANNPDPARITSALWYFVQSCLAMQPGTQYGGTFTDKPGYHNTRDNLFRQGRTNDYSVRLDADRAGPGDKTAAFDWTFPDAQRGQYGTIIRYGERVRKAFRERDPRLRGWREVLIQADADGNAEGYDFSNWAERTPDSTHLWHGHFSVLRRYLNDMSVMNGMLSILFGESLDTWRAGLSRYGGPNMAELTDALARQIHNADTYLWRGLTQLDDKVPDIRSATGAGTVDNRFAQQFKQLVRDVAELKARPQVSVDAKAVAAELVRNVEFVNTLSAALTAAVVAHIPTTQDVATELGRRLSRS